MKSNKIIIERIFVEEATESEKEQLISNGYDYVGMDDYTFQMIYEKQIKEEC